MANFNLAQNNPFLNNNNNPFTAPAATPAVITKEEDNTCWINMATVVEGTLVPIFGVKISTLKKTEVKTSYSEEYTKQVHYKNCLIDYLNSLVEDMKPGEKKVVPIEVFMYIQSPHGKIEESKKDEPKFNKLDSNKIESISNLFSKL